MIRNNSFYKAAFTFACAVATAFFTPEASAIDYTTKAINAYDHNGNLISTQIASDVQYIEVKDYKFDPETFIVSANGSVVEFTMIPVVCPTTKYSLKSEYLTNWPPEYKAQKLKTYFIGQTEVTNQLWECVMNEQTPSTKNKDAKYPVESVTWEQICKPGGFLDKLNALVQQDPQMKALMKGREFALPTEWEWEFAAYGGMKSANYKYSGSNNYDEVAWFADNSSETTHIVGDQAANELGIYDMSGNVCEWCTMPGGYRDNDFNVVNAQVSPYKGGGWDKPKESSVPKSRYGKYNKESSSSIGFRLVLKDKTYAKESFSITANGATVQFNMIPVGGTDSYRLRSPYIDWVNGNRAMAIPAFSIGETEVTNALWKAVMGSSVPSLKNQDDNFPVENVSWDEICQAGGFLDKLNEIVQNDAQLTAMLKGRKFYLPSEWEWEYAANGGQAQQSFNYSGSNSKETVSWNSDNSDNTTHLVAQKQANTLGIYDMSGNVAEWCTYPWGYRDNDGSCNNSVSPYRGGAWNKDGGSIQTIARYGRSKKEKLSYIGFRLVLK